MIKYGPIDQRSLPLKAGEIREEHGCLLVTDSVSQWMSDRPEHQQLLPLCE